MPYFGVRMPYFCRNPLILTDVYALQTPVVWHIFGAYFLQIWGVGVVRIIFNNQSFPNSFASDVASNLSAHQMTNLCVFSVFLCVEGAFGAASGGTPKLKGGAPQDELKNGCSEDAMGGWKKEGGGKPHE